MRTRDLNVLFACSDRNPPRRTINGIGTTTGAQTLNPEGTVIVLSGAPTTDWRSVRTS